MGSCDPREPLGEARWVPDMAPRQVQLSGLRELCVCGVRGAAHQGDPVLQTGLSHPAVQSGTVFSVGLAVGVWIIV